MSSKKTNQKHSRFAFVLLLVAAWVAIPFVAGDATVSADELSDTRIGATLTGAPINGSSPIGYAEYRLEDDGRRRLEVQANSTGLAAGTVLNISVNNAAIGQMTVNSFGSAFFSIDTNNGQSVPVISVGNPVAVSNGASAVVSGTFGTVTPTPSPSGSPTGSPTGSPSGTPSPNPTGSPSGTPSPNPTGSPSGTPSPNPTGSPSGTPSPSPTGSPSGTPSPNPSPSPTSSPNAGNLFAGLSGPTLNGVLPGGYAEFEIHSSRLELEVRIRQVSLPYGTSLPVRVDGVGVGNLFLESGGEGRLRLRSDDGQTVPPVAVGSTIAIQHNGNTILSGTFAGFSGPSPSPSPNPSPSPGSSPAPTPSPSPSLGRSFEAHLIGSGVQPPVQTEATGEFKVTLNAAETQAVIFGEFHNLGSSQTGARIETTTSTGITVHDFGAVGGTNGNFASVTVEVSAALVQQLRTGLWSAVITSSSNPAGEIRGRLTPRSSESDFDGNGRNDFAVYRPSTNIWYSQNDTGFSASIFGSSSDKVVSGDYDGDGRTDTAVFKNSNGQAVWEIKRSSDNGITATQFGFASDVPARGDFDGDGRTDIAVYRPSTGVWYVQRSGDSGYTIVQFGLPEDKPLPADMDGDGKDDILVFRPSTGIWYWLRSTNGAFGAVHFGMNGDLPVRGDFDGDGKNDLTVFRPSTGVWYTAKSTGGFQILQWGLNGDVPVAGNYDNDGKADVAVFRPSDGHWYILRSSDGIFQAFPFGLNGDIPLVSR